MRFLFFIPLAFLIMCSNDFETSFSFDPLTAKHRVITQYKYKGYLTPAEINAITTFGPGWPTGLTATENVHIYYIIYGTKDHNSSLVNATSLVLVPDAAKNGTQKHVVSVQHGTTTKHSEAPSEFSALNFIEWKADHLNKSLSGSFMLECLPDAVAGFVTLCPDYLGYGTSNTMVHPYIQRDLTTSILVDLIYATKNWYETVSVSVTSQLYLKGYSEGGYATYALLRELELNHSSTLPVTRTAVGGGPYDLKGTADYYFDNAATVNLPQPAFMAFLLYSYIQYQSIGKSITDLFDAPHSTNIPGLLDGSKKVSEVNTGLAGITVVNDLMVDTFTASWAAGTETSLEQIFTNNSVASYSPTTDVCAWHCTSDTTVPAGNTTDQAGVNGLTATAISTHAKVTRFDTSANDANNHEDCYKNQFVNATTYLQTGTCTAHANQ